MSKKSLFFICLTVFVTINLITAATTNLSHDEAYYWMYSRFLDWGYFDHPPMVALFDYLGYSIFQNEIGVRLFSIMATVGGLYFTYLLTNKKFPLVFWGLTFGLFAFNILGFTSVPDNALFFFAALFFWGYRRFLDRQDLTNATLLIIAITGMLYSKYHAVFVVFFTLTSNLKLLKNKWLYIIAVISTLLYLPHILWQFEHDFPSIKYHLTDRTKGFTLEYLFDYFTGTILYFGPLLLIFFIYPIIKIKSENKFTRALQFNLFGFLLFFLLMSIKGRVEMNWNVTATIPFLVLCLLVYEKGSERFKKWSRYIIISSVVLLIVLRLAISVDDISIKQEKLTEMKGWKQFIQKLDKDFGEPQYVTTTYQMASKISFYTGRYAFCKNFTGRHNQYDIWKMNDTLQGKKVVYLGHMHKLGIPYKTPQGDEIFASPMKHFITYEDVKIQTGVEELSGFPGDTIMLPITLESDAFYDMCENKYSTYAIQMYYDDKWQLIPFDVATYPIFWVNEVTVSNGEYDMEINNLPKIPGKYHMTLGLITNGITHYNTTDTLEVIVQKNN